MPQAQSLFVWFWWFDILSVVPVSSTLSSAVFEAGKFVALASLTLDPEFADISENLHFFWCRFKVLTR
jgi:hypothetical protein